jgi:hypothetical protein
MTQLELEMTPALRARLMAIRKLLAQADLQEAQTRHRIGKVVAAVRDEKGKYGAGAVEQLAAALHRDASTLYRYALVADLWSEREILRVRNCHDEPLSWSHWEALAKVPDTWKGWLERTLEQAWSSRKLARELEAAERESPQDQPATAIDTTRLALLEAVRNVRRFDTEVTSSLEALVDRLARAPRPGGIVEVRELLATMLDLVVDANKKTGELVVRMRSLLESHPEGVEPRTVKREPSRESGART